MHLQRDTISGQSRPTQGDNAEHSQISAAAPGGPRVRAALRTDVGLVRQQNEDAAYLDPEGTFFLLADGMGGEAAGEVASRLAIETVRQVLELGRGQIRGLATAAPPGWQGQISGMMEAAVLAAHHAVQQRAVREPDKRGMGTTLEVVLVAGAEAFIAHVGDSRTYLARDGWATQLTTDHTVAATLLRDGRLTEEEARSPRFRSRLVNAVGGTPQVSVEIAHVELAPGDQLLLCSDGLSNYFPESDEIAGVMAWGSPDDILSDLVALARQRGGGDNLTGIILEIVDTPEPIATPWPDPTRPAAESGAYEALTIDHDP